MSVNIYIEMRLKIEVRETTIDGRVYRFDIKMVVDPLDPLLHSPDGKYEYDIPEALRLLYLKNRCFSGSHIEIRMGCWGWITFSRNYGMKHEIYDCDYLEDVFNNRLYECGCSC